MIPGSPEIARLRSILAVNVNENTAFCEVSRADLRYALARVDESCAGCVLVEALATQARNLDRLYGMIDEMMAERRTYSSPPVCGAGGAVGTVDVHAVGDRGESGGTGG